jgi:hypothetical protein
MDKNSSLTGTYGIPVDLGRHGVPTIGNLILREDGSVGVSEYFSGRVYTCRVGVTRGDGERAFNLCIEQLTGDHRAMFISRHADGLVTFISTKRWTFGQRPIMTNPRLIEVFEYLATRS